MEFTPEQITEIISEISILKRQYIKRKMPVNRSTNRHLCGSDGTRTRDPMRDRHVF